MSLDSQWPFRSKAVAKLSLLLFIYTLICLDHIYFVNSASTTDHSQLFLHLDHIPYLTIQVLQSIYFS